MSSQPSDIPSKPKKRAPEPIGLRVTQMLDPESHAPRRVLVAATGSDADRLRTKGNKIGDLVFARISKPRSPGFHRLAHAIGKLAVENIEAMAHLEPHAALKRLQLEADAGCETVMVQVHTIWPAVIAWIDEHLGRPMAVMLKVVVEEMKMGSSTIPVRVPRSISYDAMDQIEFKEVIKTLCRYMALHYWPTMTPEQIEEMAEATKDLTV